LLIDYLGGDFVVFESSLKNVKSVKMLRVILIIVLVIVFIVPLVNKTKDYWDEKKAQLETLEETAKKAIRYSDGGKK